MPLSYFAPNLGAIPLWVAKASDTSRTSTTVVTDPELSLPLTVGTWQFTLSAIYTAGTANASLTAKLAYSGTSAAVGNFQWVKWSGNNPTAPDTAFATTSPLSAARSLSNAGNSDTIGQYGIGFLTVTSSGSFSYQWGAINAILNAGSFLTALKVA